MIYKLWKEFQGAPCVSTALLSFKIYKKHKEPENSKIVFEKNKDHDC